MLGGRLDWDVGWEMLDGEGGGKGRIEEGGIPDLSKTVLILLQHIPVLLGEKLHLLLAELLLL